MYALGSAPPLSQFNRASYYTPFGQFRMYTVHAWIWRVFASRFLTRHCAWNMEPVCNCHRFLVCSFKSCGSWWRSRWVSRGESLQLAVLFTRPVYLKIGGWETTFLLGRSFFRGYVSFREDSSFVQSLQHVYPSLVVDSFQNMQSARVLYPSFGATSRCLKVICHICSSLIIGIWEKPYILDGGSVYGGMVNKYSHIDGMVYIYIVYGSRVFFHNPRLIWFFVQQKMMIRSVRKKSPNGPKKDGSPGKP